MKIDIVYNSTVKASNFTGGATEEAAFKSAVDYVVKEYESLFTNPDTIHITVGWGTPSHPGDLGRSSSSIANFSYSEIKTALANTAAASGDAAQLAAAASLPTKNPFGSGKITVTTAEAKALGLLSATSKASDGTVNFNSKDTWSFTPGVTPAAGAYYFVGTAEHEISEVLGRISSENSSGTGAGLVDLFRYTAPGVRATVPETTTGSAYFSYDNGTTNLGSWNNDSKNGDLADWWAAGPAPGGNDSFNDYSNSGVINALTTTDVTLLNVLGWDTAYAPNDIPSGVTGWVNGTTSAGLNVLGGGYLEAGNGGFAWATTVNSKGSFRVDAGTTAQATHLLAGGTETVRGTDTDSEIYGTLNVRGSGTATNESIWSGGIEDVAAGTSASNTYVNTGGSMSVEGTASGTTVDGSLASLTVYGGAASGTVVSNGGAEIVGLGGSETGATLKTGGYELIMSTGTINGATIDGGKLELGIGATVGSSPIAFGGSGGTLTLDHSATFTGTISGFGLPDHMDLMDIAFGSKPTLTFSAASDGLSGTLTVSDGTHTANIALLGHYVATQFTMASDGSGGTLIGDPPVAHHDSFALAAPLHG